MQAGAEGLVDAPLIYVRALHLLCAVLLFLCCNSVKSCVPVPALRTEMLRVCCVLGNIYQSILVSFISLTMLLYILFIYNGLYSFSDMPGYTHVRY